jgi:metallo-beta-lactamase class B
VIRVGNLAIAAHLTPGHTPGAASWSWQSCEGSRCLGVVYLDSLNPISAPGFRFTADPARVPAFRKGLSTIASLQCDVAVSVHPGFTDLQGRLKRRAAQPSTNPFIDPSACRAYVDSVTTRLDARLAEEAK